MDRITRELGELKSRRSWVSATDHSITPSSESLDDAIAVLEADGLPFTYSFSSFTSTDGDHVSVYVWTDQRWVMVTARASSASRAKGLVAVGIDLLDVLGTTEAPASASVTESVPDDPARRKTPKWVIGGGAALGLGMISGALALFWKYIEAWLRVVWPMP